MSLSRVTHVFAGLGLFALGVLSFAAVWLGGLNQDEGWYLYAANLVAEGRVPYRDFFFTQGPVMPFVYSAFSGLWKSFGLLGGRLLTLAFGLAGILFAVGLVRRLVPPERRGLAGAVVFLLLGSNLYHLYYLAIPKTYALSALFVLLGFYLLTFPRGVCAFFAGLALALAAGTRLSLGAALAAAGLYLVLTRRGRLFLALAAGGVLGLLLVYGPVLCDPASRTGLMAAQAYHASRGGFDVVWTVGSLSRLVRWYLPVFALLGLGLVTAFGSRGPRPSAAVAPVALPLWGFLAVFAVQLLAPFPYEDYQVPVMALLAVGAAALFLSSETFAARPLAALSLALALAWCGSFGSPLLEKWMTNGQDRFWSLKKATCELAQLRDVAARIEAQDPGGKTLLTQDLYLAVETDRRVPEGLEMGPFSYWGDATPWPVGKPVALDTERLGRLLDAAPCPVAAFSGYGFAITVPTCEETPVDRQVAFWEALRRRYRLVDQEAYFGQNATTLLILKRR